MSEDTRVQPAGERRRRLEAERMLRQETGQLPVYDTRITLPTQRVPVPGGRRERRIREREARGPGATGAAGAPGTTGSAQPLVGGAVPTQRRHDVPTLESLTRVAEAMVTLDPNPGAAPVAPRELGPLTWDEVFSTRDDLFMRRELPDGDGRGSAPSGLQTADGGRRLPRPGRRALLALVLVGALAAGAVLGGPRALDLLHRDAPQAEAAPEPYQNTLLIGLETPDGAEAGSATDSATGSVTGSVTDSATGSATGAGTDASAGESAAGSASSASSASSGSAGSPVSLQSMALLAVDDSTGEAVSLLAPGTLMLDVPGAGRQTLATAVRSGDAAPANALADALEVRIDGSWLLTEDGWRALVDALGGVRVDVQTAITVDGVAYAPGEERHLDGATAVGYATALGDGEPEQSRLARFEQVLAATLAALPPSASQIGDLLTGNGIPAGDLGMTELAGRLAALRTAASGEDGMASAVLPFEPLEVGDASVSSLDDAAAAQVVATWLGGAALPEAADGPVRVLVKNGVGVPGLSEAARQRLLAQGLRFVAGGNAEAFDVTTTKVLIATDAAADRSRAQRVIGALGTPDAEVSVDPLGSSLADVIVIVGRDFADSVTDAGVVTP